MTYPTHYPVWNCPKKIEAREQTIILTYREFYQRESISEDKQYWTMSGSYEDDNHNPIEGEFHQLKNNMFLLKDSNFHAVDISSDIIQNNKKHYPNLNWHCGDFLDTMKEFSINNCFNAAIVNCDNVRLPGRGSVYLASLLMFLENNVEDEVMVVSNLMLNHPYHKSVVAEGQNIIDLLLPIYDFTEQWYTLPYCYKYHGSGTKAKTWMGSIIFIKKGKITKTVKI